ncbi:MAG: hypothetical protein A3K83_00800 [Omnitrophica WOR_2 bacterium RBG_13_44_8b]|nr:MAG: hypothetical protein A3K83_00800 [Omnitrophica WOR_2 bacterium RBG_13_44_8b]
MKNGSLLKRAAVLGFPLFDVEEEEDANLTLADMVRSKDSRLWEGFPVVLANSAEKRLLNFNKVNGYLKKHSEKSDLVSLMALSLALYKFFNLRFSWAENFYKSLSEENKKEFDGFLNSLKNNSNFHVAGRSTSANKLKSVFNNYFNQSQERWKEMLSVSDELKLEYALSQFFSPKQKELFLKKLKREKLTKTEKEYFSRVVKKKVLALANPELQRLSQKLLE